MHAVLSTRQGADIDDRSGLRTRSVRVDDMTSRHFWTFPDSRIFVENNFHSLIQNSTFLQVTQTYVKLLFVC